jgi:hypothetical protein
MIAPTDESCSCVVHVRVGAITCPTAPINCHVFKIELPAALHGTKVRRKTVKGTTAGRIPNDRSMPGSSTNQKLRSIREQV